MLTLEDAKAQLNIASSDDSQDDEIQGYVDAVTSVVERQTGEVVEPRAVVEDHYARHQDTIVLQSLPVIELQSVASVDGSRAWDVDSLHVTRSGVLISEGAVFDGRLAVTVQAGYTTVPPNYRLAALIILQHLWRVQRGPSTSAFGEGPSYPDGMVGFAVPRRASELLGSGLGGIA
ncbi:MAG: head-tail connector protein [Nocardioidaceae bacterium]